MNSMLITRYRPFAALATALVLNACGGDGKDTASASETTQGDTTATGGQGTETTGTPVTTGDTTGTPTETTGTPTTDTTTDATSDTPTTDGTSNGTGDTTTTGPDPTGDTTTDDTTTGDTTTGGDAYDQSCQALCERILECHPDEFYPDVPSCMQWCVQGANEDPGCRAAGATFNECHSQQDCEALWQGLVNEVYEECQDEFEAFGPACQ